MARQRSRSGTPATNPTHIRPEPGPRPRSAYPESVDAVVVAGTHQNPRHLIRGRNKAFVALNGRLLVHGVVEALLEARTVDRVFVVGPVEELRRALAPLAGPRLRLVPQAGKLIANAWEGFRSSQRVLGGDLHANPDRPVLFLSADLPLIQPEAVDDFVARCAEADRRAAGGPGALLAGTAEEASLAPFYPRQDRPGIVRPYVELRSGRFRLANIYIARPLRMDNRQLLQEGFSHRKAKHWTNVLALAGAFFGKRGGWRGAWQVFTLWLAMRAARHPGRIYRALRRRNTEQGIEAIGSLLLGGRLKLVVTPYGGL
ncbi:MAG: nucleotidyltransferase family protein, partial [Acidobacteriota bacterium]